MVYRIAGGLFLLFTGLVSVGIALPALLIGITALIAGIALLGGF